ncbi:uncharacterized protein LOC118727627 isoform X2 [Pipistrellus kuhlii]|uniref:uncharacterized protein LOC118727627 isoform X2 n=1 Tax=Pipistrellus kuhlii TaxID=59472 RepID=UPI001E274B09|nr:uncharacterized protein LOC118727627 isoform X2 [Pipistrellus kuhlii]
MESRRWRHRKCLYCPPHSLPAAVRLSTRSSPGTASGEPVLTSSLPALMAHSLRRENSEDRAKLSGTDRDRRDWRQALRRPGVEPRRSMFGRSSSPISFHSLVKAHTLKREVMAAAYSQCGGAWAQGSGDGNGKEGLTLKRLCGRRMRT